ncbi:MAG: hypothetical protein ACI4S2_01615 [Lachnospiraceae bacterium]
MIVETIQKGDCTCYIDDSGYINRTPEEIAETVRKYSEYVTMCLLKRKTA